MWQGKRERPRADEGTGAGSGTAAARVEVVESGKNVNDGGNGCLGAYMDRGRGRRDRSQGREVWLSGGAGQSLANPGKEGNGGGPSYTSHPNETGPSVQNCEGMKWRLG